MKIWYRCAYLGMACSILSFGGCSAWGPSLKGEPESLSALENQHKSLAGVYGDVRSDGSIKPHPQTVGVEGRVDGLVILGGPADMPNIKTGQNEITGAADQTPEVRIGDTTYPSELIRRGLSGGIKP